MKKLEINLKTGTSKEGKEYKYLEIVVGDWKGKAFARSSFEYDYLEKYLSQQD